MPEPIQCLPPPSPGLDPRSSVLADLRAGVRDLSLRGEDLSGADLSGCDLSGVDFSGVDLSGADLSGSRLLKASFVGARLCEASFDGSECLGADFSGADLVACSAERAGFGGANFAGASLSQSKLAGATFSHASLCQADLRAATLTGARLLEVDLKQADFTRADLQGVDLAGSQVGEASFQNADLRDARLQGVCGYEEANWIGADIREVNFCGAYLVRRHIMDENYLFEFRHKSRLSEVVYQVWRLTSDCGRSFQRWGILTSALVVAFALLYGYVGLDTGHHQAGFLSDLYFSVVTMTTLGYGDVLPRTGLGQVLVIVQVVCGYLSLGGLLSIFGNKMSCRAG